MSEQNSGNECVRGPLFNNSIDSTEWNFYVPLYIAELNWIWEKGIGVLSKIEKNELWWRMEQICIEMSYERKFGIEAALKCSESRILQRAVSID